MGLISRVSSRTYRCKMVNNSKVVKHIEECRRDKVPELHLNERSIQSIVDYPQLTELSHLTRLRSLTLFNNNIEELPASIIKLTQLKNLNLGMNRLCFLPKEFSFFSLEILDLSYNNLTDGSLPRSLWNNKKLRALYLSDNDLEKLTPEVGKLAGSLEVLALRSNDIFELPAEMGMLGCLKELHLSYNRLMVLPPEFGNLKQFKEVSREGPNVVLDLEGNHLVPPILEALKTGYGSLIDYLQDRNYRTLFNKHLSLASMPRPKA